MKSMIISGSIDCYFQHSQVFIVVSTNWKKINQKNSNPDPENMQVIFKVPDFVWYKTALDTSVFWFVCFF